MGEGNQAVVKSSRFKCFEGHGPGDRRFVTWASADEAEGNRREFHCQSRESCWEREAMGELPSLIIIGAGMCRTAAHSDAGPGSGRPVQNAFWTNAEMVTDLKYPALLRGAGLIAEQGEELKFYPEDGLKLWART
jgi:hypothetical protein